MTDAREQLKQMASHHRADVPVRCTSEFCNTCNLVDANERLLGTIEEALDDNHLGDWGLHSHPPGEGHECRACWTRKVLERAQEGL